MPKETSEGRAQATLSAYLRALRASKTWTLREVEEATGGEVSNAYLSQLERGKISKPSPSTLHSLARAYGVSYEELMVKAGYLQRRQEGGREGRHGAAATHAPFGDLTDEEEQALLAYLAVYRNPKLP